MIRFKNVYPIKQKDAHGVVAFLKWALGIKKADVSPIGFLRQKYEPQYASYDASELAKRVTDPNSVRLTWVGHSTFLIQANGLNVLTDPIWDGWRFILRRLAHPGIAFEDLPEIDVVLISHDHYDHLDLATIKRLGNKPLYLIPEGVGAWFKRHGITHVRECVWWERVELEATVFHFVPAQHYSHRRPFDRNKALWGGWLADFSKGKSVYFAGDTGYAPIFRDIREKYGDIFLALLPIGSYAPRWFMGPVHIGPEEAVQAHIDLGARHSVAMHWGTFRLSDEAMGEPPIYLEKMRDKYEVPEEQFSTMQFGESRTFTV